VSREPEPSDALFVGGFVAGLFALAASLVWVAGGGVPVVRGLAFALVGVGLLFAVAGGVGALIIARLE
jgi:hypothetical protein